MPYAIRIHEYGGPEKLKWEEVQVGDPGPGQVRVRHTAVGLNFIDTYHRSGLYPMPLPLTLGSEGAGVVEAVGPGVKEFKVGDRVAYASLIGAYSEVALRPTHGGDEKAPLAKKAGCRHVIVTSKEKFVDRVKKITKGQGVPVVYDGVGKDTFMDSLDCLSPLGLMVSFGNASGPVPPFNIGILAQKGSLFLTRPTLATYTAKREDLVRAARELFSVVKSKAVKVHINQTYPLREAAQAHRDLEARKTTGSTVLLP